MNAGEYGLVVNAGARYDMTNYTSLSLQFTRPDGTTFTPTNPKVSLGTAAVTGPSGTFAPYQYVNYTIADGDLTISGMYSVRLIYTDSTKRLVSVPYRFQVLN